MTVPTEALGALIDIAAARPSVRVDDLLGPGDLLVIAPHPDDETLGCGAALAAALAGGRTATVALLTNGEGSHRRSRRFPQARLARLRREEFDAALSVLAIAARAPVPTVLALGLPDMDVAGGAGHAVAALSTIGGVGTIWCTSPLDPHGDHAAAADIADRVEAALASDRRVARLDYAVWGRFGTAGAVVEPSAVHPFRLGRFADAKRAAMTHYRSQLTNFIDDDPDGFVMPVSLTEHFATTPEIFVAPRPTASALP